MKKKWLFLTFTAIIAILGMAFLSCPPRGVESVNTGKGPDGPSGPGDGYDDSWTPPADTTQAYQEVFSSAAAKVYFLAPDGKDDTGDGSKENPWFSLTKAEAEANPGDTIYLRAGTYWIDNNYGIDQVNNMLGVARTRIPLTKSGIEGKPITYAGYPPDLAEGNRPVINFAKWRSGGNTGTSRSCGIAIGLNSANSKADWIWLRDFDLTGLTDYTGEGSSNGYVFQINNANHTTLENLRIYDCAGTGVYMFQEQVCSYVLVKNCDFFQLHNARTSNIGMNQNTDGGGFHIGNTASVNNVFYGCRSWAVGDDGFDSIRAIMQVIYDHCWIAYVGFNYTFSPSPPPDRPSSGLATYNPPTAEEWAKWTSLLKDDSLWSNGKGSVFNYNGGNGNGLKLGGYGMASNAQIGGAFGTTNYPAENPGHVMRYCLAVYNGRAGVTHNYAGGSSAPGSPGQHYYNVTAYNNRINYEMIARSPDTLTGTIEGRRQNAYNVTMKNNISHKNLNERHFMYDLIDYWPDELDEKEYPVRWLDYESGTIQNNTFGVEDKGGKLNHALDGPFGSYGQDKTDFDDNDGKYPNGYQAVKDIVTLIDVTDNMFQSLDDNLFLTPRKRDGSLPETKYLRPKGGTPIANMGYTAPDNNADGFGDQWKYAGAKPLLKNW